jgi:hypothetical protein
VDEERRSTERSSTPASALRRGVVGGIVGAAAVTGVLVGIGRRAGTAVRPLNATAYVLLGSRADGVWGVEMNVTLAGVVVVLAVSVVAGMLVARLSPPHRTARALAAAAGVSLVGYLLHVYVAARVDGGLSALLSVGELRALYLGYAIAVGVGMRLAFSQGAIARRW